MREKMCREVTVDKYTEFLNAVKLNGDNPHIDLFGLIANYEINKSVAKALFDLAILDGNYKIWEWLSFEVDKKLSLTILNYLLERSKKSRATVIAGLEDTNSVLRSLSEKVTEYITRREHALKQPQIPSNGNLFAEVDTKNDLICKAAFAIAAGIYASPLTGALTIELIPIINQTIVFAAKDLVNQLLK